VATDVLSFESIVGRSAAGDPQGEYRPLVSSNALSSLDSCVLGRLSVAPSLLSCCGAARAVVVSHRLLWEVVHT
jgi:hypothetical protein